MTIDQTATARPAPHPRGPGRPFFDPHGLDHLRGFLAAEENHARRNGSDDGALSHLFAQVAGGRQQPPMSRYALSAWHTVAELEEAVIAAGDLYGPATRAAIAGPQVSDGISLDRFGLLREELQRLDRENTRIAEDLVNTEEEVERLEHELGRAQVHHDEQRSRAGQLDDVVDDARHSAAWSAAFAEQLEAALERHVPDATSRAAILREARRKAHRAALHDYAAGEDGCRRCGQPGDDVAHLDREDHR